MSTPSSPRFMTSPITPAQKRVKGRGGGRATARRRCSHVGNSLMRNAKRASGLEADQSNAPTTTDISCLHKACRCHPGRRVQALQLPSPPDARRSLKVAGAEALIFPARSPPREMNTDTPRACCAATAARFSTKPLAGASHVFTSVPFGLHLQEKGTRVHTHRLHTRGRVTVRLVFLGQFPQLS
jgi:hypothetical protein